jgi:hypothetical protein
LGLVFHLRSRGVVIGAGDLVVLDELEGDQMMTL